MINTDGSHEHVLTQDAGPAEWAPDGRHIAYDGPGGVWIMRPNGSHRRVLYSGGYFPHYAPSSRSILFYANGTMMRMGGGGANPHPINTGPIDVDAQVSPAGGCIFGIVESPRNWGGLQCLRAGCSASRHGFPRGRLRLESELAAASIAVPSQS